MLVSLHTHLYANRGNAMQIICDCCARSACAYAQTHTRHKHRVHGSLTSLSASSPDCIRHAFCECACVCEHVHACPHPYPKQQSMLAVWHVSCTRVPGHSVQGTTNACMWHLFGWNAAPRKNIMTLCIARRLTKDASPNKETHAAACETRAEHVTHVSDGITHAYLLVKHVHTQPLQAP
jgi:hypothetical protein